MPLGQNATPAIRVRVDVNGEIVEPIIWITPKSLNMARATLKLIGFDVDREGLDILDEAPHHLRGLPCPVYVFEDDYGGKLKKKAEIGKTPKKKRMDKETLRGLTQGLRDAASDETRSARSSAPVAPPAAPPAAPKKPSWASEDAPAAPSGKSFNEMTPEERKAALAPKPGEPDDNLIPF